MLIRALVILLLVLNVGVALWWALSSPVAPSSAVDLPLGVEPLRLVTDGGELASPAPPDAPVLPDAPPAPATPAASPAPASSAAPAASVAPATVARAAHCASFGPFGTASLVSAARKRVQADGLPTGGERVRVIHTATRETRATAPRSWRVLLPPLPSAEETDAVAKRIAATGFRDYYVIREGADTNAIALGLFRNESSARDRAKTLVDAGFAAIVDPVGAGPSEHWLDLAGDSRFDAEQVRKQLGVPRTKVLDCHRFIP